MEIISFLVHSSMLHLVSFSLCISVCLKQNNWDPWTHHGLTHMMQLPVTLILVHSLLVHNYSCSQMLSAITSTGSCSCLPILGKWNSEHASQQGLLLFCLEHFLIEYHLEISKFHFGASGHRIAYWSPESWLWDMPKLQMSRQKWLSALISTQNEKRHCLVLFKIHTGKKNDSKAARESIHEVRVEITLLI